MDETLMKTLFASLLALWMGAHPLIGPVAVLGKKASSVETAKTRDVSNATFTLTAGTSYSTTVSSVTAGDVIVIAATTNASSGYTSLTDSNGTPVVVVSAFTDSTPNTFAAWCVANAAAGTHIFTVNLASSGSANVVWAIAFKGARPSSPCYSAGSTGTGNNNAPLSGTFTANANDMIVSYSSIATGGTFSAGTTTLSYTLDSASPGCNCGMEYATQPTSSSSVKGSFSSTGASTWGILAVPIK